MGYKSGTQHMICLLCSDIVASYIRQSCGQLDSWYNHSLFALYFTYVQTTYCPQHPHRTSATIFLPKKLFVSFSFSLTTCFTTIFFCEVIFENCAHLYINLPKCYVSSSITLPPHPWYMKPTNQIPQIIPSPAKHSSPEYSTADFVPPATPTHHWFVVHSMPPFDPAYWQILAIWSLEVPPPRAWLPTLPWLHSYVPRLPSLLQIRWRLCWGSSISNMVWWMFVPLNPILETEINKKMEFWK